MGIEHIGISVGNFNESKNFYSEALKNLGLEIVMEEDSGAGIGKNGKAFFWFGESTESNKGIHLCFSANSQDEVDNFYKTAISLGAKCNGKPGIRENYSSNYYAAFVIDLDGNNLEALYRK